MKPHHKIPRPSAESFRPPIGNNNGNSTLTDDLYENDSYHKIQMQKSYARGECGGIEKYEDHAESMLRSLGLNKADIYQQKVLGTFSLETPLIGHEGFRGPVSGRSRGPGNMMEHMCGQQKVDNIEKNGSRHNRNIENFEEPSHFYAGYNPHTAVDEAINQMYHGFALEEQDKPCLTRTENLRGIRNAHRPRTGSSRRRENMESGGKSPTRLLSSRINKLPNDNVLLDMSTGSRSIPESVC